jgi:hypothetical protein
MPREEFYAVVVTQHAALTRDGIVMTSDNEKAWVIVSDSWDTSQRMCHSAGVPILVKQFPTEEEAADFAAKWRGHPWWCRPKSYEVVRVTVISEEVITPVRVGLARSIEHARS